MTIPMERAFSPRFSPAPKTPDQRGEWPRGEWPPPAEKLSGTDSKIFPQRLYHKTDDLGDLQLRSANPVVTKMSDLRLVNQDGLLIFFIINSLDTEVVAQVVGADVHNPAINRLHIGSMLGANSPIAPRTEHSIIVPMRDNGYPWMGLLLTASAAPNEGSIRVASNYQRWTE